MNITGDPNQQTRPSVFGFDYNYPPSSPSGWTHFQRSEYAAGQKPEDVPPQLGNFSFCTEAKPAVPVQFPFANSLPAHQEFGQFKSFHIPFRCKRKTDSPPPPAAKQHITDEKMAEHMSQLHISSETAMQPETRPVREQRLYMCEEMRRLQQESVLPQSLINRINRPCTALVLWMPPPRIPVVDDVATETNNNNEEDQVDNNVMEMDPMN